MRSRHGGIGRTGLRLSFAIAFAVASGIAAGRQGEPPSNDPLAAEVSRWSVYLSSHPSGDENWEQLRSAAEPALQEAVVAMRAGRRLLALQRLVAARQLLAANAYVEARPAAEKTQVSAFEAAWKREGTALSGALATASAAAFDGVGPAAVRAIAEAASQQVRVYYDASVEYGRNTMPQSGLYYIGVARAQQEVLTLCRTLAAGQRARPAPPLRSIEPEIDALQADVLAAYRPPASIDMHREFIGLSATLKEARELDAAGLRYGALLRYLQARLRFAPLRAEGRQTPASEVDERLRIAAKRMTDAPQDHSIAALFVEQAEAEGAKPQIDAAAAVTREAIVTDILPRYFAALEPAPPRPARPAPRATVTLVRWPYT